MRCQIMSNPDPKKKTNPEEDEEPDSDYPQHPDREHGDEVSLPAHPEGNVEIMVERGRQMGF